MTERIEIKDLPENALFVLLHTEIMYKKGTNYVYSADEGRNRCSATRVLPVPDRTTVHLFPATLVVGVRLVNYDQDAWAQELADAKNRRRRSKRRVYRCGNCGQQGHSRPTCPSGGE